MAQATKLSPRTINRRLAAVCRLMREAASQGYATSEAAAAFKQVPGVRPRAMRDRVKPHARVRIAPAEMRQLCDRPDRTTPIGLPDAALLLTLASSVLRVAEAATLTSFSPEAAAPGGATVNGAMGRITKAAQHRAPLLLIQ